MIPSSWTEAKPSLVTELCRQEGFGFVWAVFVLHCVHPNVFPLYDQNVYRAFQLLSADDAVLPNVAPADWAAYSAYRRFFELTVRRIAIDRVTIDRGLWILGRQAKAKTPDNLTAHYSRRVGADIAPSSTGDPVSSVGSDSKASMGEAAARAVEDKWGPLPFWYRGIRVNRELVEMTLQILGTAPEQTLPQNSRNASRVNTPDGLDRRLKEALNNDTRTANIISDVLASVGIVDIIDVYNPNTGRSVKGTRLRSDWLRRVDDLWFRLAGRNP